MFLESNYTEQFEKVDNHTKHLLEVALQGIPPLGPPLTYECFEDLYLAPSNQGCVFVVEEGAIGHQQDGKTLFHYDAGDLVGMTQGSEMPRAKYYAESPVILRPYNRDALWAAAMANTDKARDWGTYLIAEWGRQTAVIAAIEPEMDRTSLGFQTFKTGEVIIQEGTESDTVYSIVEGHAEVFVNNIKVGEVLEDEIFGALSLLTHSPRTATVIADTRCLVMVVPRHQFETMIKTHPRICLSLMENMARQIVALNKQVTAAKNP
ncbi:MAG TPA: cyclic nucleotide-binding domain-containing protein [Dongiaceae bacterium]|nr:cyclic nucleotide-binding domain-containing protein [Dongiaceae bacterium]